MSESDRPRQIRGEQRRRWRRRLRARLAVPAILLAGWLAATGCSGHDEPLAAQQLLGSTPEQLQARLGEPSHNSEETPNHFGAIRWRDIDGVDVLIVVKGGVATYVTYHFSGSEAFDEAAALARIGLELPEASPQPVGTSQARRWQPFGDYERLTINPETRLISIGTNPL